MKLDDTIALVGKIWSGFHLERSFFYCASDALLDFSPLPPCQLLRVSTFDSAQKVIQMDPIGEIQRDLAEDSMNQLW